MERKPVPAGEGGYELFVAIRFDAAQAVVQMKDGERQVEAWRKLDEDVEKRNGVRAAGHGHPDTLSTG